MMTPQSTIDEPKEEDSWRRFVLNEKPCKIEYFVHNYKKRIRIWEKRR